MIELFYQLAYIIRYTRLRFCLIKPLQFPYLLPGSLRLDHCPVSFRKLQHFFQLAPSQIGKLRPKLFRIAINGIFPVDAHKSGSSRRLQSILLLGKFCYAFVSVLFVELLIIDLPECIADPNKALFYSLQLLPQFPFHFHPVIECHLHIFHFFLLMLLLFLCSGSF